MAKRFVRSQGGKFKSMTTAEQSAYVNSIVFQEDERLITENNQHFGVYGDDYFESGSIGTVRAGKDIVVTDKTTEDNIHYTEIAHRTITTNVPTATSKTLAHSGKFTVYYPATVDNGHVTQLTPIEYTLPSSENTKYSLSSTANTNGATVNLVGTDSTTDVMTITDDNVINVTSSAKTDGATVAVAHAKKGPSSGYTSGNTTTSIGAGESKTIKIPQLTVDSYGHVTAGADENVTITIPASTTHPNNFNFLGLSNGTQSTNYSPKSSEDSLTIAYSTSDDISITGTRNDELKQTTLTFSHDDSGVTEGSYGSSAGDTSLSNGEKFKVPYITVNKKGHITGIADKEFTLSTPNTKVTSVGNHYTPTANDDSKIEITASSTTSLTAGTSSVITGFTVQRDAAGHVTGVTASSGKLPTDTKLTKVDFTAGTATTPSGNTVNVVSSIPDATGTNGQTVSATYSMVSVPTKSYVDGLIAASDAMVFKGTIGTGGTITALPSTGNAGWTYKVITAGTYAGQTCQVGDMIIAVKDFTTASNDNWSVIQNNVDLVGGKDTIGLIKNGSDVTSASGYTASPIINGIPYYKNTTYTSLKNPNSLKVVGGSTDVTTYDGSVAKTINVVGSGTTTVTGEDGIITISSADQYKGTVTSVGMTVPTGLSVTPSTITSSGTFAITYASGYSIPTTTKQSNWDTAYGWGNHASAGYVKSSGVTSITPGTGLLNGTGNNNITSTGTLNLAPAKTDELGGIKVASVTTSASGANTTVNTNKFAVHLDSNGLAFVAIPAYTNNSGDITGVTAGIGLAGGGTSGSVTVKANLVSETKGSVAAGSKLYYNAVSVDSNSKLVVDSSADWEWEVLS